MTSVYQHQQTQQMQGDAHHYLPEQRRFDSAVRQKTRNDLETGRGRSLTAEEINVGFFSFILM